MNSNYLMIGDLKASSHLATCGPALAKNKTKGMPTPIPTYGGIMYMPGAGLRSKLRGALTQLTLEALEKRKARRFNLVDAQLNRVGGVKQSGAESALKALEYQDMIRKNPTIGLFGASTPWVKGKLRVGHVSCRDPNLRPMHVEGVRSDIMRREPGLIEFLSDDAITAYSDDIEKTKAYTAVKRTIEDLKKSLRSAIGEQKKGLQTELKALEKRVVDENLKHVAAQQPLEGYLAIPPGAKMDQRTVLVGVSQIELGAYLAALERFALVPELGAHVAHGAGVIEGSWEVLTASKGPIGRLTIEPYLGLSIEGQELIDAKAAFEAFVDSEELSPYFNQSVVMSVAESDDDAND